MRQNQQLSQALIHPLTRIHPPVKPAGKASTTHMYTSKTYLAWPDLTVGRDVIYYPPPHPPPPPVQPGKANNKHHQQRTCTLRKHVLHSLILQSAGTLLPPPHPAPCNLARQTTTHMKPNAETRKNCSLPRGGGPANNLILCLVNFLLMP